MSDMTLKQAVEFLTHPDENYQQCGANFIHHTTFKEEGTKQEVRAHALKQPVQTRTLQTLTWTIA